MNKILATCLILACIAGVTRADSVVVTNRGVVMTNSVFSAGAGTQDRTLTFDRPVVVGFGQTFTALGPTTLGAVTATSVNTSGALGFTDADASGYFTAVGTNLVFMVTATNGVTLASPAAKIVKYGIK